jgi:hypothetical protein
MHSDYDLNKSPTLACNFLPHFPTVPNFFVDLLQRVPNKDHAFYDLIKFIGFTAMFSFSLVIIFGCVLQV